jgi:hypothetical protein
MGMSRVGIAHQTTARTNTRHGYVPRLTVGNCPPYLTVLFKMENNLPVDSWCYFPESNRPVPELLQDSTSLAAYEDIAKERISSTSKISKNCPTENGSAFCYPLKVAADVPLVLRITANKSFFKIENKVIYGKILEHFKKRILIEYALSELKNHVSKKAT